MSRSYKKYPCVKDRNPGSKREANKRIRRLKGDIPDGKWYRKIYNPWDICDWSFSKTWQEYWKDELSDWKRRFDYSGAWSRSPNGYSAHYWKFRNTPEDHWSKQNPELHKKKHFALWKLHYCKK